MEKSNLIPCDDNLVMADMYVRSAHTSAKRSYWAVSAIIIMIVTGLLMIYNEYLSYGTGYFKSAVLANNDVIKEKLAERYKSAGVYTELDAKFIMENDEVATALLQNYAKNWVDSQYVTIPILGVRIAHTDIGILLSLAFFVIMGWCFFCVRGENFTVGKILRETKKEDLEVRKYIFYGIGFNNLFFPTSLRMSPYSHLLSDRGSGNREEIDRANEKRKKRREETWRKRVREVAYILFLLPGALLLCILLVHYGDSSDFFYGDRETTEDAKLKEAVHYVINGDTTDVERMKRSVKLIREAMMKTPEKDTFHGTRDQIVIGSDTLNFYHEKIYRLNHIFGMNYITPFGKKFLKLDFWTLLVVSVILFFIGGRIIWFQRGTSKVMIEYLRGIKHSQDVERAFGKIENRCEVNIEMRSREELDKDTKNDYLNEEGVVYVSSSRHSYALADICEYARKCGDKFRVKVNKYEGDCPECKQGDVYYVFFRKKK